MVADMVPEEARVRAFSSPTGPSTSVSPSPPRSPGCWRGTVSSRCSSARRW
ncbi:hypothetical protein ACFQ3Z_01785 [Streptomyces nogalater]